MGKLNFELDCINCKNIDIKCLFCIDFSHFESHKILLETLDEEVSESKC